MSKLNKSEMESLVNKSLTECTTSDEVANLVHDTVGDIIEG